MVFYLKEFGNLYTLYISDENSIYEFNKEAYGFKKSEKIYDNTYAKTNHWIQGICINLIPPPNKRIRLPGMLKMASKLQTKGLYPVPSHYHPLFYIFNKLPITSGNEKILIITPDKRFLKTILDILESNKSSYGFNQLGFIISDYYDEIAKSL